MINAILMIMSVATSLLLILAVGLVVNYENLKRRVDDLEGENKSK